MSQSNAHPEETTQVEVNKESVVNKQAKRVYRRVVFTPEEEETLVEFVKSNEELYNPKNHLYTNRDRKNQLWEEISSQLKKTGNV